MPEKYLPLSCLKPGEEGEIVEINAGHGLERRLMSMGIIPGKKVKIITNQYFCPLVIKIENTRLGIGYGIANKIIVKYENGKKNLARVWKIIWKLFILSKKQKKLLR